MSLGRLSGVIVSLAALGGSMLVVQHRQDIQDWLVLQNYTAPPVVKALADNDTMTQHGRELFYVSTPSIDDRAAFNTHCNNHDEQTIVLGCYTGQRIHLYNVVDSRLPHVQDVTAAHEMLHAAYERISSHEKDTINALIATQLKTITDQRILGLIENYNRTEPGELYNEMHSILGTEYRGVSPELEAYYKRYFSNRLQVVGYSEQYQGVFTASKQRIAEYDKQLQDIKTQIDSNDAELGRQRDELAQDSKRLDRLRTTDTNQYNQAVPVYNAKARQYNQLIAQTRQLVDNYNSIVEKRNAEVANERDLTKSLDSRFEPAP